METFSIAGAGANDGSACAELLVRQLAEHGVQVGQEDLMRVLRQVMEDERLGFLLVARKESRVVGVAYAATMLSAEHCGYISSLEELYVAGDCRKQGIGSALLTAVFEEAKRRGLVAIQLEVDLDHEQAIPLYRRFGFIRLDRSRWVTILK